MLKNIWYKTITISSFVWPKGNIILKLRIIICFILLFAGNATNVLKPLYEKKIIDSVTGSQREFRFD